MTRPRQLTTRRSTTLIFGLAFALGACNFFPGSGPGVVSVTPADGATRVPTDTSVIASLNLPTDEMINLTTLTDGSVSLSQAGGAAVTSKRTLSEDGKTLTVTPTVALTPNTSYTFAVTSELRTEADTDLGGWQSSFTTGIGTDNDSDLVPDQSPVVFTAGGAANRDTRSLTLTNSSSGPIDVSSLTISGDAAAQFSLTDDSAFSLAAGATKSLELTFNPQGLGPQLANLSIKSNAEVAPTLNIPLGGLGVAGQGGNKEPSLQWIFDSYGLPIASGDTDPGSTGIADSVDSTLLGDEVSAQSFIKASPTEPVSLEVLATFGVENTPVLEFGYYKTGAAAERTPLFAVQSEPGLNSQRLDPELEGTTDENGNITFDPGATAFGLYSYWPSNKFFSRRYVFSEDRLNSFTAAIPHQVRAYPYKDASGAVVPNAYVLATEEFSQGFDYNDIVAIVRNVVPQAAPEDTPDPRVPAVPPTPSSGGISGLSVTNTLGMPSSSRMVLHHITTTFGKFCNVEEKPDCDVTRDLWRNIDIRDSGVVRLQNTGGATLALDLSFYYPDQFLFPNGESSVTLQPGDSYDLAIEFSPVGRTVKAILPDALIIRSGSATAGIELKGLFMARPEGGNEIPIGPLVNQLFGFTTDIGASGYLKSDDPASPPSGDEVRSVYWQAADPLSPVTATMLAAFYPCCGTQFFFELIAQGATEPFARLVHNVASSHTIYPRAQTGDDVAQLSVVAPSPFEFLIADYSSDPTKGTGYLGVRFWPLKDQTGATVPNTYIVVQDFARGPCGGSGEADGGIAVNCDYNDNMFIVSNIVPIN